MLKIKNLKENIEDAKNILSFWNFSEKVTSSLIFWRSSATLMYQLKDGLNIYYLRLIPIEELKEEKFKQEILFTEYLMNSNFQTPKIVYTSDHKAFANDGKYKGVIFENAPGKSVDDCSLNDNLITIIGDTLGKLHKLSSAYNPQHIKYTYLNEILQSNSMESSVQKETMSLIEAFSKLDLMSGMIHGDYESDNMFYNECLNHLGIIDFNDCCYGYYMQDIVTFFENIKETFSLDNDSLSKYQNLFLHAYQKHMPKNVFSQNVYQLFVRLNHLLKYFQIKNALSDVSNEKEPWMDDLVKYLENKEKQYLASIDYDN